MGKNSENSNGTGLLALAMKRVFKEAVEEGVAPLHKDMGSLREDMENGLKGVREDLESGLKTTDQNVQNQLAQHRKDVASDFKKVLGKS